MIDSLFREPSPVADWAHLVKARWETIRQSGLVSELGLASGLWLAIRVGLWSWYYFSQTVKNGVLSDQLPPSLSPSSTQIRTHLIWAARKGQDQRPRNQSCQPPLLPLQDLLSLHSWLLPAFPPLVRRVIDNSQMIVRVALFTLRWSRDYLEGGGKGGEWIE